MAQRSPRERQDTASARLKPKKPAEEPRPDVVPPSLYLLRRKNQGAPIHLPLITILVLMLLQFRGSRAVFAVIGWLVIFALLAH